MGLTDRERAAFPIYTYYLCAIRRTNVFYDEQQELHQVTLLPSVLLNLLAIFQDASLIAKLLKTFLELLWGCLVGIILYCNCLV